MDEIRTVHQCLFCPQTFGSASEKDDHILQHFAQETCRDCDQNLIRIGSNLYTLHNAVTCIKVDFKSEEPVEECQQLTKQFDEIDSIPNDTTLNPLFIKEIETKPDINALNEQLILMDANNLAESCGTDLKQHENIEPMPYSNHSLGASESKSNQNIESNDCDICGKVFKNQSFLKRHKSITHSAPGHFQCEPCQIVFTRKDSLRKHNRIKHDPSYVTYKCAYCHAVFSQISSLEKHLPKCKKRTEKLESEGGAGTSKDSENIGNELIDVDLIKNEDDISTKDLQNNQPSSFTAIQNSNDALPININEAIYVKKKPTENDNKCDVCFKMFFDKNNVRRHKMSVHGLSSGPYPCTSCKEVFITASDLIDHKTKCKKETNDNAGHECPICKMLFSQKYSLLRHMQLEHDPNVEKFRCKLCSRVYTDKSKFENHPCGKSRKSTPRNRQNSSQNIVCDICGRTLSGISFRNHQIRFHSPAGTNVCICRKIFSTAEALDEHRVICEFKKISRFPHIHLGKTFQCHLCQKVVKEIDTLKRHMRRTHLPNENLKCKTCGMICQTNSELRNHYEAMHLKILDHLCSLCGRGFKSKQSLRYHMYWHTGNKYFRCKFEGCEEAFYHPMKRLVHMQNHAAKKTYYCDVDGCNKQLNSKNGIKIHKKKVHLLEKK
ncbi:zinc finger protein 91-like [Contarinia nasturtii]|uniref:zinc finger protein 91-like n=1 Tax=Contarinia nasturtii TaxID=265458 RepID=UPI0012D47104|nr:zinc finger protein 91-like [Contarinia nasturtii]